MADPYREQPELPPNIFCGSCIHQDVGWCNLGPQSDPDPVSGRRDFKPEADCRVRNKHLRCPDFVQKESLLTRIRRQLPPQFGGIK